MILVLSHSVGRSSSSYVLLRTIKYYSTVATSFDLLLKQLILIDALFLENNYEVFLDNLLYYTTS